MQKSIEKNNIVYVPAHKTLNKNNPKYKTSVLDSIAKFIFSLLIFFMLSFPRHFQMSKMIMMGVLVVYVMFSGVVYKKTKIFYAVLLNLAFVALGTLVAFVNRNEDIFGFASVNFLSFIIVVAIFFSFKKDAIPWVMRAIIVSSIYIVLYNIVLVVHMYGIINIPIISMLDPTANVGFHEGFVHITSTNISMLMFSMPLIFSLLIYAPKKFLSEVGYKRATIFMVLMLNILIMFLSGRRVMWLNIVIVAIMLGMFNFSSDIHSKKRRKILRLLCLVGLIFVIAILAFNASIRNRMFEIFQLDDNIRVIQMIYLWNGFLQRPFFGTGFGSAIYGVPGYEGSTILEVTYNLMLYNTGIFGVALYLGYVMLVIYFLLKEIRANNIFKPLLISSFMLFALILVNNASNPYLMSSFDFHIFQVFPLWMIYLSQNCKTAKIKISHLYNCN